MISAHKNGHEFINSGTNLMMLIGDDIDHAELVIWSVHLAEALPSRSKLMMS